MKKENKETIEINKRIFSEPRGRYTIIDGQKMFNYDFPTTITLEENFAIISFIKDEVLKAINAQEAKKENKSETEEDPPPKCEAECECGEE